MSKQTVAEMLGLSGNQFFAVLMSIIALMGLLFVPYYAEHWPGYPERITRETIKEEIEKYLHVEINSTISLLQKPCSVILGKYSSHTWALNATSGKLWMWHTNATKIWNWAIHNMTGGRIFVRNGAYVFTGSILPKSNVDIYGESMWSAKLSLQANGIPLFKNTGDAVRFNIDNLWLEGNKESYSTTYAIDGVINRCIWTNIRITNFGSGGIRLYGHAASPWNSKRSYEIQMNNFIFSRNAGPCILHEQYSSDHWVNVAMMFGGVAGSIGVKNSGGGGGTLYKLVHFNQLEYDVYIERGGGEFDTCFFDGDNMHKNQVAIQPTSYTDGPVIRNSRFLTGTNSSIYPTILVNATNYVVRRVILQNNRIVKQGSYAVPQNIYQEIVGAGTNIINCIIESNYIEKNSYGGNEAFVFAGSNRRFDWFSSLGGHWSVLNLPNNSTYGTYILGQAGENLNFGDVVYLDNDNKYKKTNCNSTTTMYAVAMTAEDIAQNKAGYFLIDGYIKCGAFPLFTVGSKMPIYTGWTPGDVTQTKPSTSGDQIQIIGYALASQIMRFDPVSIMMEKR